MKTGIVAVLLCLYASRVMASDWFLDDWEEKADAVSEGELIWYSDKPADDLSRVNVSARFMKNSHENGWMQISQCHRGLAAVQLAQIVFEGRSVRALKVEKTLNIESAHVTDNTVQLTGIRQGAEICVSSEQQALYKIDDHHWAFISGPFQRRFLDGYYPMFVEVEMKWPGDEWRFIKLRPHPGPVIKHEAGYLKMQAHFAGRLKAGLVFQRALQ